MFTRTMGDRVHIDAGEQEMVRAAPIIGRCRLGSAVWRIFRLRLHSGVGHQGSVRGYSEGYRAVDEEGERDFARGGRKEGTTGLEAGEVEVMVIM